MVRTSLKVVALACAALSYQADVLPAAAAGGQGLSNQKSRMAQPLAKPKPSPAELRRCAMVPHRVLNRVARSACSNRAG